MIPRQESEATPTRTNNNLHHILFTMEEELVDTLLENQQMFPVSWALSARARNNSIGSKD